MYLLICVLMSILLRIADGFTVKGSSGPLFVPRGGSVVLPCSVDSLLSLKDLEVEWRRSDSQTLIHLYQYEDIRPESQHQDYHDRAHFFTEDIKHGNFSLLLNNLTAEDEGQYTCKVHTGQESGETVMEIKHVETTSAFAAVIQEKHGYSGLHVMVLIFCITACGSVVIICSLIYRASNNKEFVVNHGAYYLLGDSVHLPCFIDPRLLTESLKVEWRRSDSQTLVHLYEDGDIKPDVQHQDYHDRAHFFTENIKHGDFSVLLNNVREEDKGVYKCTVSSGQRSVFSITTKLILGFFVNQDSFYSLEDTAVLPCSIAPELIKKKLKVEWRRSDSDSLVHLYEDGNIKPKAQHQDYRKRANFFTEDIKHGNFSLQLKNLTAEDKGEYTCKVYSEEDSTLSFNSILELGFVVDCTVVSLGGSVRLPCFIDPVLITDSIKVEWRRSDSQTLIHLYQDEDIRPEAQHQDYHDRAHFFTEDIKHGNFSLRLDHIRPEDEGEYTCKVYSGQNSTVNNTSLTLRLLYTAVLLQLFLVFCPNLFMFFAFIFWGVSEGSVNETIFCCTLYFLRPLLLLFAAPYCKQFKDNIKIWIQDSSFRTEYILFSTVLYSVLFHSARGKGLSFAGLEKTAIMLLFGAVVLFCLFYIIFMLAEISGKLSQRIIKIFNVPSGILYDVLPSLQFILLYYTLGFSNGDGFYVVVVLPVIITMSKYDWNLTCGKKMGCSPLVRRLVWSTMMLLLTAVMMYLYTILLKWQKDRVGWACMIGFLQVLWTVWHCIESFEDRVFIRITAVYMFGSVGVVLINAVALMTELRAKTVNSQRLMGDLRIVVFSSEIIFTLSVLMLIIFAPWIKKDLQYCQIGARCKQRQDNRLDQHSATAAAGSDETQATGLNQNTAESHEMKPLLKTEGQDAGGAESTAETELDSVKSQT